MNRETIQRRERVGGSLCRSDPRIDGIYGIDNFEPIVFSSPTLMNMNNATITNFICRGEICFVWVESVVSLPLCELVFVSVSDATV